MSNKELNKLSPAALSAAMTKNEQMLEMILQNQALLLRAAYDHASSARLRQQIYAQAEATENWLKYHPPKRTR
jgi:hypothetical protein